MVIMRWARAVPIVVWFCVCAWLIPNRARAGIVWLRSITVAIIVAVGPSDYYRFSVDNSWLIWSTVDIVAYAAAVVIW